MHQTFDAALGINLLHANQSQAEKNLEQLTAWGITCLNVMSSPGAGKTVLLKKTLESLAPKVKVAVIEGDMTTQLDAEQLRQTGTPVIGINTGRSCHLDARMVAGGIHQLSHEQDMSDLELIFVENVGNLVCPAEFEVGEQAKVALLSVTEGEDKPLKYPLMFQEADCLLITKLDLVPHLDIDLNQIIHNVRQMNPTVTIIPLSTKTGFGMDEWLAWIFAQLELDATAKV